MKRNLKRPSVPILAILFCSVVPLRASSIFGTIQGAVKDQAKVPLQGATVTAAKTDDHTTLMAVSKSDGTYEIPGVEPGMYSVTAQMKGFRDFTMSSLEISPGSRAVADIIMVAEASEP